MGKIEIEGKGQAVCGEEEDYLAFDPAYLGITELVEKASGTGTPHPDVLTAFRLPGEPYWQSIIDSYRKVSGRKWPPVYHVKIVCEAEELPPAETEAYWVEHQAKWLLAQEEKAQIVS